VPPVTISAAVEGLTDEAVALRLIRHVGADPGPVYGRSGKLHLRDKIGGYNAAARHAPWLVLVDLDREDDCAPPLRMRWIPHPAPQLCFRVVVRAVEAWLMADAEGIAAFLGIARGRVPANPEAEGEPKQALVNLARAARSRAIQRDIVPREGSGRSVGPAYSSRLIEFASDEWQPERACARSDSLRRAVTCLRNLAARHDP
jgi:hypothetical protein